MGKAEETSQQTTSALKTLIDLIGFYSAEEAAEKFNLSMDEVNKILGATLSTTENLTAAEEAAVKAIESISAEIEILQTSYNEAFKSANEAIESHMGLWEQMDNSVVKSVEDIALALTQKAWLDTYNRNLVSLSERQISGVGDLVESLSDGTKESASILAGLASATDEEVSQIIYSLGRVGDSKDTLSHTMAGIATDFSKKMNTLSEKSGNSRWSR